MFEHTHTRTHAHTRAHTRAHTHTPEGCVPALASLVLRGPQAEGQVWDQLPDHPGVREGHRLQGAVHQSVIDPLVLLHKRPSGTHTLDIILLHY